MSPNWKCTIAKGCAWLAEQTVMNIEIISTWWRTSENFFFSAFDWQYCLYFDTEEWRGDRDELQLPHWTPLRGLVQSEFDTANLFVRAGSTKTKPVRDKDHHNGGYPLSLLTQVFFIRCCPKPANQFPFNIPIKTQYNMSKWWWWQWDGTVLTGKQRNYLSVWRQNIKVIIAMFFHTNASMLL